MVVAGENCGESHGKLYSISTLSPVMSSAVPSVLPLVALMELMNFLRDFLVRVWHVKVRHADSGFVRLCSS